MPLINRMCEIGKALQASTVDLEVLLNDALSLYSQLKDLVQQSFDLQWKTHWPSQWPVDLSELCRARMLVDWRVPDIDMPTVTSAVRGWHLQLHQVLAPLCEGGEDETSRDIRVLVGFNFVNDLLFAVASADDLDRLAQAWGIQPNSVNLAAVRRPQNLAQVYSCLLYAAQHPDAENKFYIDDPQLLGRILQGAINANLPQQRTLGGAAGNTAFVLSNLGIEVDICCPYLSSKLNWANLGNAMYVGFANQPRALPIAPQAGLPVKTTLGFQLIPWGGPIPGHAIQVNRPSRVLFIGSDASSPQPKQWNQVVVVYGEQPVPYPAPQASQNWQNPYIWPYPPLFCTWQINGNILEIHPVSPDQLAQLVQDREYKVAIIKEAGRAQRTPLMRRAWEEQLQTLQQNGIPVHVELSEGSNLGHLKSCLRHGRWSVSLNQDDLIKLTEKDRDLARDRYDGEEVDPFLFKKRTTREPLFDRFIRAKHLLDRLEADWIYVHGNELDLAVWRPSSGQDLGRKLRDAMLLAKVAVVAAMIDRHTPPTMLPLVRQQLQGVTLAPKGFWALFEFVSDFASWASTRYNVHAAQVRASFLSRFGDIGWYQNDDFGVAVAPVFWPDVAKFLNATGAGDYSSAVVAAYVWGS